MKDHSPTDQDLAEIQEAVQAMNWRGGRGEIDQFDYHAPSGMGWVAVKLQHGYAWFTFATSPSPKTGLTVVRCRKQQKTLRIPYLR